ncbi:MAG: hypothetical protein HC930_02900 [Hydrococcus sp. SU_1_0]|nr:hypothetical protein [Hydrococcus sp. SU_1_0]
MVAARARTPKYKSQAVFWNTVTNVVVPKQSVEQYRKGNRLELPRCIERFDSQHEFKVYLELVRMYGAECIIKQYPLEIIAPGYCYPKGKLWKVDFAILQTPASYAPSLYVEAKGVFLPEFGHTLASFEQTDPETFYQLFVVFTDKLPIENLVVKNLLKSPCKNQLMTLKQLKDSIKL